MDSEETGNSDSGDEQVVTPAAVAPPIPPHMPSAPTTAQASPELMAYIALARQQPGIIPEMIYGASAHEVQISMDAARLAYTTIAATIEAQLRAQLGAAVPPAMGGAPASPVPTTAFEMIKAGLKATTKNSR